MPPMSRRRLTSSHLRSWSGRWSPDVCRGVKRILRRSTRSSSVSHRLARLATICRQSGKPSSAPHSRPIRACARSRCGSSCKRSPRSCRQSSRCFRAARRSCGAWRPTSSSTARTMTTRCATSQSGRSYRRGRSARRRFPAETRGPASRRHPRRRRSRPPARSPRPASHEARRRLRPGTPPRWEHRPEPSCRPRPGRGGESVCCSASQLLGPSVSQCSRSRLLTSAVTRRRSGRAATHPPRPRPHRPQPPR